MCNTYLFCGDYPTLLYRYIYNYVSLDDRVIPNRGYVVISDIGSTDDTALICHTNRPATQNNNADSGGDWFGPDETRVDGTAVPGFRRNI